MVNSLLAVLLLLLVGNAVVSDWVNEGILFEPTLNPVTGEIRATPFSDNPTQVVCLKSLTELLVSEPHHFTSPEACLSLSSSRIQSRSHTFSTEAGALSEGEISRFLNRCVRGTPFNEQYASEIASSGADRARMGQLGMNYLRSNLATMSGYLPRYVESCNRARNVNGTIEIDALQKHHSPMTITGQGNFFLASIMQLEYYYQQMDYLIELRRLPPLFSIISTAVKNAIIPVIASANGGPTCNYTPLLSNPVESGCREDVRRTPYFMSDWMIDAMYGTFNRLNYYPPSPPRSLSAPHALNPNLDWPAIENSYISGSVLRVDNILAPSCHAALLQLAREGSIFYDAKNTYLGAYIDFGLGEHPWLSALVSEFRERFPTVIGNLPLGEAWFYSYDSEEARAGGIGTHVDQAAVNINIWLTEDEANNDPESGGLVVYDKGPTLDSVLDPAAFNVWNNVMFESVRGNWLREQGAQNVTVPYRSNRAVIFDSTRLHKTDKYNFKPGYKNRRINLTLLFLGVLEKPETLYGRELRNDLARF